MMTALQRLGSFVGEHPVQCPGFNAITVPAGQPDLQRREPWGCAGGGD
jgi:hypothetical protein